jgi:hypothetical protein
MEDFPSLHGAHFISAESEECECPAFAGHELNFKRLPLLVDKHDGADVSGS